MKKPHLLILLFLVGMSGVSAQITLEHVYPHRGMTRAIVPGAGERYYAMEIDTPTNAATLFLYTGTHAPAGTIHFSLPAGASNVSIVHLSTNFFDSDPGIECCIRWLNPSFMPINTIFDENGAVIANNLEGLLTFFTVDGVNKILTNHEVYTVPGFQEEHSFSFNVGNTLELEDEGRKFWYLDVFAMNVVMLNKDYSPYKTYELGLDVLTGCPYNLSCFSKFQANTDDKVEWGYYTNCNGEIVYRFFSDDDLVFETTPTLNSVGGVAFPRLPDPGLDAAKASVLFFGNFGVDSIQVYDIFSGVKEHVFQGFWGYNNVDIGESVYYPGRVESTQTTFDILDTDYHVWATFPNFNGTLLNPSDVSTNLFDNDLNSKEVFSIFQGPNSSDFAIWRTDGTVLFEVSHPGTNGYINKLPGLPNKLIFSSFFTPGPSNESFVYSLPSTSPLPTEEVQKPSTLYFSALPNPFSGALRLDLSQLTDPVTAIKVTNITGQVMYQNNEPSERQMLELSEAAQWPKGIYLVQLRSGAESGIQKVIKQ